MTDTNSTEQNTTNTENLEETKVMDFSGENFSKPQEVTEYPSLEEMSLSISDSTSADPIDITKIDEDDLENTRVFTEDELNQFNLEENNVLDSLQNQDVQPEEETEYKSRPVTIDYTPSNNASDAVSFYIASNGKVKSNANKFGQNKDFDSTQMDEPQDVIDHTFENKNDLILARLAEIVGKEAPNPNYSAPDISLAKGDVAKNIRETMQDDGSELTDVNDINHSSEPVVLSPIEKLQLVDLPSDYFPQLQELVDQQDSPEAKQSVIETLTPKTGAVIESVIANSISELTQTHGDSAKTLIINGMIEEIRHYNDYLTIDQKVGLSKSKEFLLREFNLK